MNYKLLLILFVFSITAHATELRHRFYAKDESRSQLHYVDQFDPLQDWTIAVPRGCRDIQLIDEVRILMSHPQGYLEYDVATQQLVKEVMPSCDGLGQIESVIRLPNGHTVLAGRQGHITIVELDAADQLVRRADFKALKNIRLLRFSPEGHFLFGAEPGRLIEATWEGELLADITVPNAKHIYWVQKKEAGAFYRLSSGYGKSIIDISPEAEVLRTLGGTEKYAFFARPFELQNGNIVVSHWTGHGHDDSRNAPQLVEFNAAGDVVWSWHDAERAGTIHGVIVLGE